MPLLSTIGGAPPTTLGNNGYSCTSCAHRLRLEHIAPPTCVLTQIALARIALADRPSFPNLPPGLPLPIALIALLACAGAPGTAKGGLNSKTSCESCAPGKYSGTINSFSPFQSRCDPCAEGKFSAAGSSYCPLCAAGKYSKGGSGSTNLKRGEGDCEPCAAGKYSGSGWSHCTNCAAGKYSKGRLGVRLYEKGQGECEPRSMWAVGTKAGTN